MTDFRNKDGETIGLTEWATLYERDEYRRVAKSENPKTGVWVSTIWTGFDKDLRHEGEPAIFDTAVLVGNEVVESHPSRTLDQALAMHEEMCRKAGVE